MTRISSLALIAAISQTSPALAARQLDGIWSYPGGQIRVKQKGSSVVGSLVSPIEGCPLKKGAPVLNGMLLEDSLTGEIQVCQQGDGCAASTKAFVILLVAQDKGKMSGALHLQKTECRAPDVGERGGLTLQRSAQQAGAGDKTEAKGVPTSQAGTSPGQAKAPNDLKLAERAKKALDLMQGGAVALSEGRIEDARARFVSATEVDPARAEAYNGVGVTYYVRQQYTDALAWYKRGLEVDTDFGDSYYNMACIYAQEGKKELALRYLKIAILNRYLAKNDPKEILEDQDFASLKEDPDFLEVIKLAQ